MNTTEWRLRAARHLQSGQLQPCLSVLDEWIAGVADAFEPRFLRVQTLVQQGRVRAAADQIQAMSLPADLAPEFASDLVRCLRYFAAHDLLIEWAGSYRRRDELSTNALVDISADLAGVGEYAIASVWLDAAAAREPKSARVLIGRALNNVYLGRAEAARDDLSLAARLHESQAMAYWLLTRLERQTAKRNHLYAMRKALVAATAANDRAYLNYALFKTYDDLGEHAAAWDALARACVAAASQQPYVEQDVEAMFAAARRSIALQINPGALRESACPIFVVGMHRSGTTLVERLLGGSPDVYCLGETRRLAASIRYAADVDGDGLHDPKVIESACLSEPDVIARHFSVLAQKQACGHRFAVDKTPDNFLALGFIRAAMPWAKVVHVRRQPVDLCFANMREMFQSGVAYRCRQETLVHFHRAYEELMTFWRSAFPGFILEVDYESLVRNPAEESRRIFEFCNIDWTPGVTAIEERRHLPSSTLSAVQVRAAIHTSSVGRWHPYIGHLGTLISGLDQTERH